MDTANSNTAYFDLAVGHPFLRSPNLPGRARYAFIHSAVTPAILDEFLQRFWKRYFKFARQDTDILLPTYTTNATNGIMTAAKILAKIGRVRVGISDPMPKFIHDILHVESLLPIRLDDKALYETGKIDQSIDALFLAIPGNPSGNFSDETAFRALMRHAREKNIKVVADFCFRLFAPLEAYDQYKIMREEGVDFIAIENTGKTFDAGGQKLGLILTNSENLHLNIQYLENMRGPIPPASAWLVESVARHDMKGAGTPADLPVRKAVRENRKALEDALYSWDIHQPKCDIPFAAVHSRFFALDQRIAALIKDYGVYVSPLGEFFGEAPLMTRQGIRIALARDPQEFNAALKPLMEAVRLMDDPVRTPFRWSFGSANTYRA